jgi:hypothetical protein
LTKRILVSEELYRKISRQVGLGEYKLKLGRWVIKREVGVIIGCTGKDQG